MAGHGKYRSRPHYRSWDKVSQEVVTPLAIIQFERKDQLRLCDDLELVADQLCGEVHFSLCESINEKLRINLPVYHRNEEALFDCVRRHTSSWIDISSVLECVRHEHAIQSCYATELYENLEVLHPGSGLQSPDTIGYMLRFFFESLRRHLVWEDLTLMPLTERCLTTENLADLSGILAENRKAITLNIV